MEVTRYLLLALAAVNVSAHVFPSKRHGAPTYAGNCTVGPGDFTFDELWDLNQQFWTAFMSPNNEKEAAKINSTIFSEHVQGRIDATRQFVGRELNTEYIFGLFSTIYLNPNVFTIFGVPINYRVTEFAANVNVVATTVIVDFNFTQFGLVYPIEIGGWFTYDENKQISQYDGSFLHYLEWQLADMFAVAAHKFNTTDPSPTIQKLLAGSVCNTHQKYCNGTNTQYQSRDECVSFLTNGTVPLGAAWQLGMNTLACRTVHMAMVPERPDVHCAHIGPSGGGYCTNDREYSAYVTDKTFYTHQSFLPYGKS